MKKTLLTLAVGALFAASSGARADVFARAYNEVTNLVISTSPGVVIGGSFNNSSANACLPNGTCVSRGGAGFTDAPVAQIGLPIYVNNSYASHQGFATSYAVADASIDSQQLQGAPYTRARNFAEGQLLSNSTANANAGNSSATLLRTSIIVGSAGGTVNFRFDAHPYILSYLSANSMSPAQAEGSIELNFSIINNRGNVVFNWAPDGYNGSVRGGVENADAFTLNTSLTAMSANPGPLVFDPSNCAVGSLAGGCFNATSNPLAAGIYTMNLSMRQNINLQSVAAVPEPEAYAMFIIGLGLLAFTARRRHPASAKFE